MNEIIGGIKENLGNKVKDVYRLSDTEVNIMLYSRDTLDEIYQLTENLILNLIDQFTIAKINFVDEDEQILASFSLTQ